MYPNSHIPKNRKADRWRGRQTNRHTDRVRITALQATQTKQNDMQIYFDCFEDKHIDFLLQSVF